MEYEPSAPLQTLLNALGGPHALKNQLEKSFARRNSQQSGHLQVLRRLGGLVDACLSSLSPRKAEDGDKVFDPVAFYDFTGASAASLAWLRDALGRLIDLVAPFEDIAAVLHVCHAPRVEARETLARRAGITTSEACRFGQEMSMP